MKNESVVMIFDEESGKKYLHGLNVLEQENTKKSPIFSGQVVRWLMGMKNFGHIKTRAGDVGPGPNFQWTFLPPPTIVWHLPGLLRQQ